MKLNIWRRIRDVKDLKLNITICVLSEYFLFCNEIFKYSLTFTIQDFNILFTLQYKFPE